MALKHIHDGINGIKLVLLVAIKLDFTFIVTLNRMKFDAVRLHFQHSIGFKPIITLKRNIQENYLFGFTFNHSPYSFAADLVLQAHEKAFELVTHFPMTVGNSGYGLVYYADVLYDGGHSCIFLRIAHDKLLQAIKGPLEGEAATVFKETIQWIE